MSVSMTKYLGYVLDITEEVKALGEDCDKLDEFWESLEESNISDNLKALKVKTRYFRKDYVKTGDIEVVLDGLCNSYAALILIVERDCEAEDDGRESDDIEDKTNEFLKQILVSEEIKNMLYKAYELLFNHSTNKEIALKIYRAWS